MNRHSSKKVAIVYKFLPQWREAFFTKLRDKLSEDGIVLDVFYGKLKNEDSLRNDEVDLEWGTFKENILFKAFNKDVYWQPFFKELTNYDLVIVEQASKLLLNYALLLFRRVFRFKVAFWGHGRNMQVDENDINNRILRLFIRRPDWWFAYTTGVAEYLKKYGVNEKKITAVRNTIDTSELTELKNSISENDVKEIKNKYGIGNGPVAIFSGGLVKIKEVPFLIESCNLIKNRLPEFEIIIMGDGPYSKEVNEWAKDKNWVHFTGPKFGKEKAALFKTADVLLLPGLIGLVIVDAFIFETPLITTAINYPSRSPEFEYLKENYNGVCSEYDPEAYASKTIQVLCDRDLLNRLKEGCRADSINYSIENMLSNFSNGIKTCLEIA